MSNLTLQDREQLAKRLQKAADYAEKEWEFHNSVAQLSYDDAFAAFQRYRILSDAASDVFDFNFGEGE